MGAGPQYRTGTRHVSFAPSARGMIGVMHELAPTGTLRATINLGNALLARRGADGSPAGVSVDLAQALAQRLGVPLALVVVETAAAAVAAVREGRADVGFFAIDPLRSEGLAFTAPYLLIEGSYLVRADSPLRHNDEVDRPGTRVVVGHGSAYDLFLSRTLRHATIERAPSTPEVVPQFLASGADVAAGIRQALQADAERRGGLRLLPGRFMVIEQAMGCRAAYGEAAHAALAAFVEEAKRSGQVAALLARHGVTGASVAPAA
ncbi:lysine-arginine-ornithine-binding periplasmic protein [Tepidimonas sediminis]|uniref:Lysine-arginine-ornithine-binding periplasmic protein n=2 Tax=Tepidimonas sediminis TaxID=2588941 RepID=A0A554WJ47_9BURK|nr:lysine-arginine-ornithine-binding periplasmic protein [Tepidimonas sediminis]